MTDTELTTKLESLKAEAEKVNKDISMLQDHGKYVKKQIAVHEKELKRRQAWAEKNLPSAG